MSAHKIKIVITQPAAQDLRNLFAYTLEKWGNAQLLDYQLKINIAFEAILDNPAIGKFGYSCQIYPVAQHRIFYDTTDQNLIILRVLHRRMDVLRHLPEQKEQ